MSSATFGKLNPETLEQVRKYLTFFRQKKDALLRTIMRELSDMKNDTMEMGDITFSKEDMENFADKMISSIRGHMSGDLGTIINMGALSVSQLLESAQDKGCELELETSAVENVALLDAIERMSLDAIVKPRTRGIGQLTSLKDEVCCVLR
jgi:hypothetical protein